MNADEFWAILHSMPLPRPVFYRLYYDADGLPIVYTQEDLPGTYIDVDPETFAISSMNVRVVDNKLIKYNRVIQKLMPSDTGTPCHPDNVAIVVREDQPHQKWSMKTL